MSVFKRIEVTYVTRARALVAPLAGWLAGHGVTPNGLTFAGLTLNICAVPLIVTGHFVWAAVVFLVASVCDMLDGSVARLGDSATPFGAFFDSTADRIAEGITLGAVGVYYARADQFWVVGAVFVALTASFLVSYTRARAEALGLECKVGLMSRPERIVLLMAGFLLSPWHIEILTGVVYLLAVLTSFTVVQRVLHVRAQMLSAEDAEAL